MSARSGEICCKTQAVWERLRGIAGDSSTSLRSARNDGATPRHCERSEAIQTNDTKRPLDCFTACFVPRNSSPFAMTFHSPRHFDRSARGTSARSGEICCKTQGVCSVAPEGRNVNNPVRSAGVQGIPLPFARHTAGASWKIRAPRECRAGRIASPGCVSLRCTCPGLFTGSPFGAT